MSEAATLHANQAPVLLAAEGVDKSFFDGDREIRVLRGLDFEVRSGERVAIVGQSGVGKSTLLHLLGSLERPTGGRVIFDGHDIFSFDPGALSEFRNRNLGFVFQFHFLLPDFTALENVMMPALIGRIAPNQARSQAATMLKLVGLGDKFSRRPAELSGGEQQRVAVARAVVLHPRLLLADEPTGNLDPHTADEVQQLFNTLNEQLGITLVVATHNERLARSTDRTLRLRDGRLYDEPSA
jgi:lipoprotein-releasing system ATP-binding protein